MAKKSIFGADPRARKRGRGLFVGQPLSGSGNLGDRPQAQETEAFNVGPDDDPRQRIPFTASPLDAFKGDMRYQKVIVANPAKRISIIDQFVGSTKPLRLDVGLRDRTDVMIANMSNVVIWINTFTQFTSGQGYPLAPNTEAGAYNGATIALEASKEVEWYGIGASGASNLVVVFELAR